MDVTTSSKGIIIINIEETKTSNFRQRSNIIICSLNPCFKVDTKVPYDIVSLIVKWAWK